MEKVKALRLFHSYGARVMIWIASIIFAGLLLGALVRLVLSLQGTTNLLPKGERLKDKQRLRALAIGSVTLASLGFFCLFTTTYDPFDILIGVSLVSFLWEVALRRGSVNWAG